MANDKIKLYLHFLQQQIALRSFTFYSFKINFFQVSSLGHWTY